MTEYKLSYTASEIDEKLGMVDSMVKTVNGVTPDESGNVEVDLTGYATEEFVANYSHIKPAPVRERKISVDSTGTKGMVIYYIDIEQLEDEVPYGFPEMTKEEREVANTASTFSKGCFYQVYCDDGTSKKVASSGTQIDIFRKLYSPHAKLISLTCCMPSTDNIEYVADITDKSTANNVIVTKYYNNKFLGINNTVEFTPTNDYQPATKKYVDDAIASIDIPEVDLTGCATEEFVNTEIIANQTIRPFKCFEVNNSTNSWMGYVDIEEMIPNTPYSLAASTEEVANKMVSPYVSIVVRCDDGTKKSVKLAPSNDVVWRKRTTNNKIVIYSSAVSDGCNTWITVDITDKSTKDNVVVTKEYNKWFLPTYASNHEYTPTNDYNPATKKYVDDAIAALRAELTATTE